MTVKKGNSVILNLFQDLTSPSVKFDDAKNICKIERQNPHAVLDLSQKHPIWAPLALVVYEC